MLIALVKKELLALLRDLHGLVALFIMPAVFIIVMSLALRDVYSPPIKKMAYAILDQDQTSLSADLIKQWAKRREAAQPLPAHWSQAVKQGQLKYVLVVEKGYAEMLKASAPAKAAKARIIAEPGIDAGAFSTTRVELALITSELRTGAIADSARDAAETEIKSLEKKMNQMGQTLASIPGAPPFKKITHKAMASKASGPVSVMELTSAERLSGNIRPSAVQQSVPAWLIFGMFFVVAAMSSLFIQERQNGVMARLRSLGVPRSIQIAAKAIPYLLVNFIQAALMLAVGVWLMPHLGGDALVLTGIDWSALTLMLAATSAAAVSLALTLACLVRTHAQASATGPILNCLMAALGGIMVPIFVMPPFMQQIAVYSPMNWALEGLLAIILRGAHLPQIVPWAIQLLVFAASMLIMASLLFRQRTAS